MPRMTLIDHDIATCSECASTRRDMQRRLKRLERLCRCCGTRVDDGEIVYVVGDLDSPLCLSDWRMCAWCWRAGYQLGETLDRHPQGGA